MKRSVQSTGLAWLILLAAAVFAATESARAEEKATEKAEKQNDAVPADLFAVPEGSPEELLEYIQKLEETRPPDLAREEVREFQQKQHEAIVRAAEKIIAAKPDDEKLEQAAISKAVALNHLSRYGEQYVKRLEKFPQDLKKAGHAKLARDMTAFLLERELMQSGRANQEDLQQLLKRVEAFLAEGTLGEEDARLAITTARAMQGGGDQLAAKAYGGLGKLLAKSDDESIAGLGGKMLGVARRMDLVGNKMELEGTTVDGDPLEWSKYRGKVTLVMFWATWCGPCRREIVHVLDVYDEYHERGFEVVGISVDESRDDLDEFLKENKIPWTIVFDQARADGEKGEPMGERYGVMGIPETVLVDRQGKAVATGVRGPELDERLETMIGPKKEESEKKSEKRDG
ncbi:MAG: redoxin domain-containing protein [Rhodopirellula sp.]|nr:redoxin domain-containing protein [Rhodopirellula sp.]